MTTLPKQNLRRPSRGAAAPLDDQELAQAAAIARQLAASLRALAAWAPPAARKVRPLAAFLGVDQNLAQRALAGTQIEPPEILTLTRVPGVEGLRLLAQAARSRGCDDVVWEGLESAAARFGELIALLSGSHAKLRARITETLNADRPTAADRSGGSHEERRGHLFESAAELLGLASDLYGAVSVIAPVADNPDEMTGFTASAHVGLRGRPGGIPVALTFADRLDDREEGGPMRLSRMLTDPRQGPGGTLVTEFSTNPLPVVTANAAAQSVTHVVEPALLCGPDPVDVVVATRRGPVPIPRLQATPTQSAAVQIRTPTRRLVLDFWVHRTLAPTRVPQIGAFIYQPGMPLDPARAWYNRLPGTPVLQVLGDGLANADCDGWARFGELTRSLFDGAGLRGEEFIGFRCDVRFPVWCTAYVLWLDYSPAEGQ